MTTCIKCGDKVEEYYHLTYMCFTCNFWQERVEAQHTNSARIEGQHYIIGDERREGAFRGYGGARFRIRYFDGREVKTTNLWCQGEIPQNFRDALPDNAEFVR